MKVNKKISLALLSVALLGAGTSLIESQGNSTSTVVQAAKKKSKAKSKAKKSTKKSTKSKSKKTKKSVKSTKSKKSTKKSKKKTMTTSQIYKALFGKKSNDATLEKYRDNIVKVAKQMADKQNGTIKFTGKYYVLLQATKNTHSAILEYPDNSDDDDNGVYDSAYEEEENYQPDPIGMTNGTKIKKGQIGGSGYFFDDDEESPIIGVEKLFGKYYYWTYDYTGNADNDEDNYDYYPVSDFKVVLKKLTDDGPDLDF